MNREQKLENALKVISENIEFWRGGELRNLKIIADEALEPELVPKKGKLYCFYDNDNDIWFGIFDRTSNEPSYPYLSDNSQTSMHIRELTDQEWLDLGAPQLRSKD